MYEAADIWCFNAQYTEVHYKHGSVQHRIGYNMVTPWTWHFVFQLMSVEKKTKQSQALVVILYFGIFIH